MYYQFSAIVIVILAIAGIAALYLFLFAPRAPKSGIVVARRYTPAHELSAYAMSYGVHGAMPPPMAEPITAHIAA